MSKEIEQRRLVATEYVDARYMYAAANAFQKMERHEARWRMSENGWKFYKTAVSFMLKALDEFAKTIPDQGKRQLKADLENSRLKVHTATISGIQVDDIDMVFHTRGQLAKLMKYATADCELCDKTGKDVVKCKKRQLLESLVDFEVPVFHGESCCWNDYDIDSENGADLSLGATWESIDADREKVKEVMRDD